MIFKRRKISLHMDLTEFGMAYFRAFLSLKLQ